VKFKLSFITVNNRKQKDLSWISVHEEDIWTPFTSALLELWPEVKLPSPESLSFKMTEKGVQLCCTKPLVINGVSVINRVLKTEDRIILGPLRVFFQNFEIIEEFESAVELKTSSGINIFRNPLKLIPAAALILALSTAGIVSGCITTSKKTALETPQAPLLPVLKTPESVPSESVPPESVPPESVPPEKEDLSSVPEISVDIHIPIVVIPGGAIPKIDLDILFIHAHPDDESLDFGTLMALADSAGLKTGHVVFTDGESGLDMYPDRPISGIYPDHYLKSDELAAVRSGEVEKAAAILGVDLLIRLGLKNHPYNSVNDEFSPEAILDMWGGKDYLITELLAIIDKTNPEIVVAPDAPGLAHEHFEHEAVGYLAAELMAGFELHDSNAPKRFITSIDPRQKDIYPEASNIYAEKIIKNINSGGYNSLREVQLKALMMHKTQNDAVNVGTNFLPEYPSEYYQIQFWRTNQSWNEWITALGN